MPPLPDPERQLSEADIEAIAQAVHKQLLDSFYSDVGRGLVTVLWRAFVVVLLGIAAIGAVKSGDGSLFH